MGGALKWFGARPRKPCYRKATVYERCTGKWESARDSFCICCVQGVFRSHPRFSAIRRYCWSKGVNTCGRVVFCSLEADLVAEGEQICGNGFCQNMKHFHTLTSWSSNSHKSTSSYQKELLYSSKFSSIQGLCTCIHLQSTLCGRILTLRHRKWVGPPSKIFNAKF